MSFVGNIQKLIGTEVPWWLRGKNDGAFLQAHALTLDSAYASLRNGLALSHPLRCDSSALPTLSRERGIRIYPTEPEASKRYRLSRWWQLRRQFGTHIGQGNNIAPMFLPSTPTIRFVHQDGNGAGAMWWTRSPAGVWSVHRQTPSNWNFDGATAKCTRYWCIIYRPAIYGDVPLWNDGGHWDDDGRYWDGLPNAAQIADIVAGIKDAGEPSSMLWGVAICNEPTALDPTGTSAVLGDGSTTYPGGNWGFRIDNTTGVPTRPPYLSWIYDKGQG